MEFIGKIFDHVTQSICLDYKMLALGFGDGLNSNIIDFSIHVERGKNPQKPFGLSKKELNQRYSKKRDSKTPAAQRFRF